MRHPDPAPTNRDDSPRRQILGMTFQHLFHDPNPSLGRDIREANQATMPFSLEEDQIPEVLVHGHENPLLRGCPDEDRGVSGIRATFLGLQDVMAQDPEPICESTTGAPVD
jgi:hypothetical protein